MVDDRGEGFVSRGGVIYFLRARGALGGGRARRRALQAHIRQLGAGLAGESVRSGNA